VTNERPIEIATANTRPLGAKVGLLGSRQFLPSPKFEARTLRKLAL
jgi:hypothetical protein